MADWPVMVLPSHMVMHGYLAPVALAVYISALTVYHIHIHGINSTDSTVLLGVACSRTRTRARPAAAFHSAGR